MNQAKGDTTPQKRIMEINPYHAIAKMGECLKLGASDPQLEDDADILYGFALDDSPNFRQVLLRVPGGAI